MTGAPPLAPWTRGDWLSMLRTISDPVLRHGAAGTLKAAMPVEAPTGGEGRRLFAHLEACSRTLAGIAPWLELGGLEGDEARLQSEARVQAQALVASIADPASPDHLNFGTGMQPLVDTAFLAQAILRAPTILWNDLPGPVRGNILRELAAARTIAPPVNNWLLFAAMIESLFAVIGLDFDRSRIDRAIRQFDAWYVGDGWYADGPLFHFDYYNSFVIHPFLLDILRVFPRDTEWAEFTRKQVVRAQRHAAQIERMIGADGAMPAIGRSLSYRCGNLHLLAQLAVLRLQPRQPEVARVREAMARAISRSLSAPGTFDADGWLTIGCCGHQPGLAEDYISTGSLYLCTLAFLPLGLAPGDAFWAADRVPTTGDTVYGGHDAVPDHAIGE
ncbi:DUF2264 domain-containing protein [Sphingopyxis sp.]|uniref:DUF2264 domain-containing protein n=1 Tax=Sphingopyxis sp. TaxID=1908224 RepID=UPI003BAB89D0